MILNDTFRTVYVIRRVDNLVTEPENTFQNVKPLNLWGHCSSEQLLTLRNLSLTGRPEDSPQK